MIASLDGSTVVSGRSGPLSTANDSAMLGALRRVADVIIVGAGTVRQEGYGPPRKPDQRIGVVTSTGAVDTSGELFTTGAGFMIMPEDGPRPPEGPDGALDVVRAGTGRVDLAIALSRLDDLFVPPVFVHVEGGAQLNGALLDAGCVDELNLTTSPRLVGGTGARVTAGAPDALVGFHLVHLAVDDESFLYSRWQRH